MSTDPVRRRGDATRTRAALLDAARVLFVAQGYDRTTVRAIAERAEVNQALLFRYFGSKEALFSAAVSADATALAEGSAPEDLLAATVRALMTDDAEGPLHAILRSPGSESALAGLRDELAAPYRRALAALADGDGEAHGEDAALRADLMLAWLLGIGFARSILRVPSLDGADPDTVVTHVKRATAALLAPDGPSPSVG